MREREISLNSLNEEERKQLKTSTRKGRARARKIDCARISLLADTNGEHLIDTEIAKVLGIASTTVLRTKRLFAKQELQAALGYAQAVRFKPRKLDGRNTSNCATFKPVGFCKCRGRRSSCAVIPEFTEQIAYASFCEGFVTVGSHLTATFGTIVLEANSKTLKQEFDAAEL